MFEAIMFFSFQARTELIMSAVSLLSRAGLTKAHLIPSIYTTSRDLPVFPQEHKDGEHTKSLHSSAKTWFPFLSFPMIRQAIVY